MTQSEKEFVNAACRGDITSVRELLSKVDVNVKNEYGATGLMYAVGKGYDDIAEVLLNAGADPNLKDGDGWTSLMLAAFSNRFSIVDLLIKRNADPTIKSNHGHQAADFGHVEGMLDKLRAYTKAWDLKHKPKRLTKRRKLQQALVSAVKLG